MPIDRDKILQSAQKLVDKKRFDKAIVEYQKLVADDAGDVRTLLKIGDLHLKLDKHEDAIATYEKVGEYYYREGFAVKAIAVYKQIRGIIKRHASHLEGRYSHIAPRLAEIYTQLGLTSDALSAYDEVASRLRQDGRERDALDIFKKVLELDPQNPIAHLRVADSYTRLGDIGKAVERFGEAANIMVKLGRLDDAIKVLERLLEYRQEPLHARTAAELLLTRNGPNDGLAALAKLQLCFKADPRDLTTLATLARAFDIIGQPKKAVEVLKESARVAREKKDDATFNALVDTLLERAPDDPTVQQLEASRKAPAAPEVSIIEDVEVLSVHPSEDFDDGDAILESSEEMIELPAGELHPTDTDVGDLFASPAVDEPSAVRRIAEEADVLHSNGEVEAAMGLLRDALRNLGSSPLLRQKLSDLLLEWGDQEGCIQEKLTLATELAHAGNFDGAMGMLDEVLLLQPEHPEAQQLRWALGYGARTAAAGEQGIEDIELNAPLGSYDVESGGVDQALARPGQHGDIGHIDEPFQYDAGPPVGEPGREPYMPAPSPSLRQLDEDALDRADALAQRGQFDEARVLLDGQLLAMPNHPLVLERLAEIDELAAAAQGAVVLPPGDQGMPGMPYPDASTAGYGPPYDAYGQSFSPAPSEGGFGPPPAERTSSYGIDPYGYANQNAAAAEPYAPAAESYGYADPNAAAAESYGYADPNAPAAGPYGYADPNAPAAGPYGYADPNAAAAEPYGYADPNAAAAEGYAPAAEAYPYPDPSAAAAEGYAPTAEAYVPAAEAYAPAATPRAAAPTPGVVAAEPAAAGQRTGGGYAEVNDVLEQFREGIRRQIDESDAQTHYDLGVAYNEMGLYSDAISELTIASRDRKRECVCLSLIGQIHLQNGDVRAALDALHRALNAEHKTPDQQQALAYEIANAYELNGMPEQSLHYFEWLATYAPDHADPRGRVAERVQALRSGSGAQRRPLPTAAEAEPEDVDAALDDMFGKGS